MKSKNKPKLRFKEFKQEWSTFKINEIFNISAGGDIDSLRVSKAKTKEYRFPIYAHQWLLE